METINELYDRLGVHKWWQEPLPENSIMHELPLSSSSVVDNRVRILWGAL